MKTRAIRSYSEYQNMLEGLRAEYPVIRRALGDERFEEVAIDLRGLSRLPVETLPGPGRGESATWSDFIVDLARLERSFNAAFFGLEDESRLDPSAVREIPREQLKRARLKTVASSRLLALRYPVVTYFQAVQSGRTPHAPAPAETFALLSRSRDTVAVHEISRREFVVLGLLKRGETVSDALAVIDAGDDETGPLGTDPRTWIERWAGRGLFGSISV